MYCRHFLRTRSKERKEEIGEEGNNSMLRDSYLLFDVICEINRKEGITLLFVVVERISMKIFTYTIHSKIKDATHGNLSSPIMES